MFSDSLGALPSLSAASARAVTYKPRPTPDVLFAEGGVAYLEFASPSPVDRTGIVARSVEVASNVIVDYGVDGTVLGVEVLDVDVDLDMAALDEAGVPREQLNTLMWSLIDARKTR